MSHDQQPDFYNMGDRVVMTRTGRHGIVLKYQGLSFTSAVYSIGKGGLQLEKDPETSKPTYYHTVKTDEGYIFSSIRADELTLETPEPTPIAYLKGERVLDDDRKSPHYQRTLNTGKTMICNGSMS